MTPDHVRRTNRALEAQLPGAQPLRFAFTPNDGTGTAHLLVDRERIDPAALFQLVRNGTKNIVEGTVERTPDGFLAFRSAALTPKRLASMVTLLSPSMPIVDGARLEATP